MCVAMPLCGRRWSSVCCSLHTKTRNKVSSKDITLHTCLYVYVGGPVRAAARAPPHTGQRACSDGRPLQAAVEAI